MTAGRYMLTSELIRAAFPKGVSEEDYPALIWVLDDAGMSMRSIATALAESGDADWTSAYHDVSCVLSDREAHAAHGRRIIEMMRPHGYDEWLAAIDMPLSQIHLMRALERLQAILQEGRERQGGRLLLSILKRDYGSEEFWAAVTGLEIWGGSGSLFDQAFVNSTEELIPLRQQFYRVMLELSGLIEREGRSTHFVRSAGAVLHQWLTK